MGMFVCDACILYVEKKKSWSMLLLLLKVFWYLCNGVDVWKSGVWKLCSPSALPSMNGEESLFANIQARKTTTTAAAAARTTEPYKIQSEKKIRLKMKNTKHI